MAKGRPRKSLSAEAHFSTWKGKAMWEEGLTNFKNLKDNGPIDDGQYNVTIKNCEFLIPSFYGDSPKEFIQMTFNGPNYKGRSINKTILVKSSNAIMEIARIFNMFNLNLNRPPQIEIFNGIINKMNAEARISIETKDGIQNVEIIEVLHRPELKEQEVNIQSEEVVEAIKEEPEITIVEETKPTLPPPQAEVKKRGRPKKEDQKTIPVPPIQKENSVAQADEEGVEVKPGDRVVIEHKGEAVSCKILTLVGDTEAVVLIDTLNEKAIITGDKILRWA